MKYSNVDTLYDKMSEPVKVCFLFPEKIQSHLPSSFTSSSSHLFKSSFLLLVFEFCAYFLFDWLLFPSSFYLFTFIYKYLWSHGVFDISHLWKVISKSLFRLIQDLHFSLSQHNMFWMLFSFLFLSKNLSTDFHAEWTSVCLFDVSIFYKKKRKSFHELKKVLFHLIRKNNLIFKYLTESIFPGFPVSARGIFKH